MLTTFSRDPFSITVDPDTTSVSISSGIMQIGQTILEMDGTRTFYSNMTGLYGNPGKYQYSLLVAKPYFGMMDMTAVTSDMTASLSALSYPSLPDATSKVIGAFTFYNTSDGTVSILSYSRVV